MLEVSIIGMDFGVLKGLTPSLLETLFGKNLLEVCIRRDLVALKGLTTLQLEPIWGANLLEVSTGRDFGVSKRVNAFTTGNPFGGQN